MSGVHYTFTGDDSEARLELRRLEQIKRAGMLANIGERMAESADRRFDSERRPDGEKWQELSPTYLRRKKEQRGKVLTLRGYLRQSIHWQPESENSVFLGCALKVRRHSPIRGRI